MSKLQSLLAALILVAAAAPAHAEPSIEVDPEVAAMYVPGGLTADAAAARARRVSPAAAHEAADVDAATAAVDAAKIARIPQVTSKLSYTRLSRLDDSSSSAVFAGVGLPAQDQLLDHYAAQTQVVVPLSDYVLRHPGSIGAARAGADAARANLHVAELGAAHAARRAYYEWIRARLQLVISTKQLAQVRANLEQIRATVTAGRLPKADLLRIESQEAEVEQSVDRLRTLAELREEALRVQIGAQAGEALSIGEDIGATLREPAPSRLDDLTRRAATHRLDLRAIELGLAANEARRSAEAANRLPTLSAFATTEYSNPNQRVQDDQWTWTWTAGVQLTWSLHDHLISRTTTRKLAAEASALRADREALSRDVRIAVLAAQQDIANAQHAIATTRKGLDAAEEAYRVRRALLAADRVTAVELVDAETDLTRARISALDARIDLRIAIASLDHAVGNDR